MSDLEPGYWRILIWRTIRRRVRTRQPIALLRELWYEVICHDNVQTCNNCGLHYQLWMSSGPLYERVVGHRGGGFCLRCFEGRANAKGIRLLWQPHVCRDADGRYWEQLDDQIGAYK